jgi:hypothetical protein
MARKVIESPVVVAEPVDCSRVCVGGDPVHDRAIELVLKEDGEENVRTVISDSVPKEFVCAPIPLIHNEAGKVKVDEFRRESPQSRKEGLMLEADASRWVPVVVLGRNE